MTSARVHSSGLPDVDGPDGGWVVGRELAKVGGWSDAGTPGSRWWVVGQDGTGTSGPQAASAGGPARRVSLCARRSLFASFGIDLFV